VAIIIYVLIEWHKADLPVEHWLRELTAEYAVFTLLFTHAWAFFISTNLGFWPLVISLHFYIFIRIILENFFS
jgi:hypothetical protein